MYGCTLQEVGRRLCDRRVCVLKHGDVALLAVRSGGVQVAACTDVLLGASTEPVRSIHLAHAKTADEAGPSANVVVLAVGVRRKLPRASKNAMRMSKECPKTAEHTSAEHLKPPGRLIECGEVQTVCLDLFRNGVRNKHIYLTPLFKHIKCQFTPTNNQVQYSWAVVRQFQGPISSL